MNEERGSELDVYTVAKLRQRAERARREQRESFERCDVDGFLSQATSGAAARRYDLAADIIEAGGRATFPGLYAGDRRVRAKLISTRFGEAWKLHESERALIEARGGRDLLPAGVNSRVLRQLGLSHRDEQAPAYATLSGSSSGPRAVVRRAGSQWGDDAELVVEERP